MEFKIHDLDIELNWGSPRPDLSGLDLLKGDDFLFPLLKLLRLEFNAEVVFVKLRGYDVAGFSAANVREDEACTVFSLNDREGKAFCKFEPLKDLLFELLKGLDFLTVFSVFLRIFLPEEFLNGLHFLGERALADFIVELNVEF